MCTCTAARNVKDFHGRVAGSAITRIYNIIFENNLLRPHYQPNINSAFVLPYVHLSGCMSNFENHQYLSQIKLDLHKISGKLPFTCHLSPVTYHLSSVTSDLSLVTCQMSSLVTCHLSLVTCHMSPVTCHTSHVTCHIEYVPHHLSHVTYQISVKLRTGQLCGQQLSNHPGLVQIIANLSKN